MSLNINIRKAEPQDVSAVYRLVCLLEDKQMDKNYFGRIYSENLKSTSIFYRVIEAGGEVIGFISMHIQELLHHESRVAEVQELCVDINFRKMGLGKILLAQAVEEAEIQKCELIELAANRKRVDAHRFYEREGWDRSHFKFTKKL